MPAGRRARTTKTASTNERYTRRRAPIKGPGELKKKMKTIRVVMVLYVQVDQSAAELKRVQEQIRSNQTNASLVSILKTAGQYDSL